MRRPHSSELLHGALQDPPHLNRCQLMLGGLALGISLPLGAAEVVRIAMVQTSGRQAWPGAWPPHRWWDRV